jgi:hypothetical protein
LTGLDPEVHYLMLRVRDTAGQWSPTQTRSFLLSPRKEDPITSIFYRFRRGIDQLSFTYELNEPTHELEMDLSIDVPLLMQQSNYEMCFSVVTRSGQKSSERCQVSLLVNNRDLIHSSFIQVFPNPASEQINIELKGSFQPQHLVLFDSNGKQVRQMTIADQGSIFSLNLQGLAGGLYSLVLESENGMAIKPILVVD